MESIQAIKNRISSIASTRQITQSMRLVSTAKVQRCRDRMEKNRTFLEEAVRMEGEIAAAFSLSRHPFLIQRREGVPAVIVISGDRGLCGGYNIGACKEALSLLQALGAHRLIVVGARAGDYFKRRRKPIAKLYTGVSETPFFDDAAEIASLALEWYNSGEVNAIHLVYTRFQSLLSQLPTHEKLLPVAPPQEPGTLYMEPPDESFPDQVVPFCLTARVFGAMLESSSCEQSARITSMDAAVKNSDEMIAVLTTRYNQARQGAITQEITEIVGGADALKA